MIPKVNKTIIVLEWPNDRLTKIQYLNSWVQRLDFAIANITAESLNFWLIKLVKEQSSILCK